MGKNSILVVIPDFQSSTIEVNYKKKIRSKFDLCEKKLSIKFFNHTKPMADLKNLLKKKNIDTVIIVNDLGENHSKTIKDFLLSNHSEIKNYFSSIDELKLKSA